MTGEQYVEAQMARLRIMKTATDDPYDRAALEFALANLHVGPASVAALAEARNARKLALTIFNHLGTIDADKVGEWIGQARLAAVR